MNSTTTRTARLLAALEIVDHFEAASRAPFTFNRADDVATSAMALAFQVQSGLSLVAASKAVLANVEKRDAKDSEASLLIVRQVIGVLCGGFDRFDRCPMAQRVRLLVTASAVGASLGLLPWGPDSAVTAVDGQVVRYGDELWSEVSGLAASKRYLRRRAA